ncbi:hypothetical protein N7373_16240 [Achromobacter mucicolens]|uniref:hypothetical protein n=1 Tax=Achromobacter mucicolens TaxID=1389922 RepID=UPI00244CF6CA|nr:hypothetical protein [Achromobacter mucicolens]MDH0093004.1 hypothetical protein [Achromobacter mucicolens]
MTTHSRIAAFLSTSALCLGLATAPSAFAAGASKTGDTKTQAHHKHHKADKSSAKHSAGAANTHKSGATTPTK